MTGGVSVEFALFFLCVGLLALMVSLLACMGADMCLYNWRERRYWAARASRRSARAASRPPPPPATSAASFPLASAPPMYPALHSFFEPPSYEVVSEVEAGALGSRDGIILHAGQARETIHGNVG